MDNRFIIRAMTPDDLEEIVKLEKECFTDPWSLSTFIQEVKYNHLASYVVVVDQSEPPVIVGYAGMWIIGDEAHITNVAVLPAYRGHGLGKALMVRKVKDSIVAGADKMSLEVRISNETAIQLYKGLNFKEAGIRRKYYEDNKEDALIMWKYYEED